MSQQPLALIIDDEPDIRELLEITLSRMAVDCLSAENEERVTRKKQLASFRASQRRDPESTLSE
ncbi:MAG: hypothetical protein R6U90_01800 [Thiohalophilus sp.]